jgi:hypothetical protein
MGEKLFELIKQQHQGFVLCYGCGLQQLRKRLLGCAVFLSDV